MKIYKQSDMVDVVDANDQTIPGLVTVPKAWVGTALLPAGTKKGSPKSGDDTPSRPSRSSTPKRESGQEPPRNGAGSSTEEWVAFARESGATDADLLDDTAEPLTREALIAKYGTEQA